MSTDTAPPVVVMGQMIAGSVFLSRALYVAAQLGIADLLAQEPQSPAALAEACGAHAPSLGRVLRALASVGVFAEDQQGRFGLTPLAETLRSDATRLAARAGPVLWRALAHGTCRIACCMACKRAQRRSSMPPARASSSIS